MAAFWTKRSIVALSRSPVSWKIRTILTPWICSSRWPLIRRRSPKGSWIWSNRALATAHRTPRIKGSPRHSSCPNRVVFSLIKKIKISSNRWESRQSSKFWKMVSDFALSSKRLISQVCTSKLGWTKRRKMTKSTAIAGGSPRSRTCQKENCDPTWIWSLWLVFYWLQKWMNRTCNSRAFRTSKGLSEIGIRMKSSLKWRDTSSRNASTGT